MARFTSFTDKHFAVAVSGGADSLALMVMLAKQGLKPVVLTVDHKMRPEAAQEASYVKKIAHDLGLEHETLVVSTKPTTQAEARQARYQLLAAWCRAHGISQCALGHHAHDQAETFLFRLYRNSGLEGLSAMCAPFFYQGCAFVRPLLDYSPATLKSFLEAEGVSWCDDPSNYAPKYTRTHLGTLLSDLPLQPSELTKASKGAYLIKQETKKRISAILSTHGEFFSAGYCRLAPEIFTRTPERLLYSLLGEVLCWVSGAVFRPRTRALQMLLRALRDKKSKTLGGCQILYKKHGVYFFKEPARMEVAQPGTKEWDNRFYFTSAHFKGITLGALGELAYQLEATAIPRAIRPTLPALWRNNELIAVPHLKVGDRALGEKIKFLRDLPFLTTL